MTADAPIVLVAVPCFNADGGRACSGRGLLFDAMTDDRLLVHHTVQPLLDGCRVLLAEGCDSRARIVMRHQGSATDALRARVGVAAGLSVSDPEGAQSVPGFRRFEARDYARESSPARFGGEAAITGRGNGDAAAGPDADAEG
jgi:hypothetical protein